MPLVADWSDYGKEVETLLTALNEQALPVLAIFPADDPSKPIVLSGAYSRSGLIKSLKEAGPSRAIAETAMRR